MLFDIKILKVMREVVGTPCEGELKPPGWILIRRNSGHRFLRI